MPKQTEPEPEAVSVEGMSLEELYAPKTVHLNVDRWMAHFRANPKKGYFAPQIAAINGCGTAFARVALNQLATDGHLTRVQHGRQIGYHVRREGDTSLPIVPRHHKGGGKGKRAKKV